MDQNNPCIKQLENVASARPNEWSFNHINQKVEKINYNFFDSIAD